MTLAEFEKSQSSGVQLICDRVSWGQCWPSQIATRKWSEEDDEIYLCCDHHAPGKATPIDRNTLLPEIKLSSPRFAKLRSVLQGQYGIRLESTGARASAGPVSRIIMQTLDVSPTNPCVVEFTQFITDPFTGVGQFDLVEHDSSDAAIFDDEGAPIGGVTIATKAGFTDGVTTGGWSRLAKEITVDKIYSVVFVPGPAGVGSFSIIPRELIPLDPDQTPEDE